MAPEQVADAAWHAHRYDAAADTIRFVHADRAAHRAAPFLRDVYLPESDRPSIVPRAEARAMSPEPAPLHFIFHTGYCCSTLLARAFDAPGHAMGLKEPLILNDLASLGVADPARLPDVLDDALTLLARPFAPGEAVIVKPSNVANNLIAPILAARPEARALLIHAPLRAYLPSIANKGMVGRGWVRMLLNLLIRERRINLDYTPEQLLELTDLQVAALGWLAQQMQLQHIALAQGRARVATIDSDALLADPAAALARVDALFGTGLGEAGARAIAEGPVFATNAKTGEVYGAQARAAEQAAVTAAHGDEIAAVADWAEALAARGRVPMVLAAPL